MNEEVQTSRAPSPPQRIRIAAALALLVVVFVGVLEPGHLGLDVLVALRQAKFRSARLRL